jgi:hypothetical protein
MCLSSEKTPPLANHFFDHFGHCKGCYCSHSCKSTIVMVVLVLVVVAVVVVVVVAVMIVVVVVVMVVVMVMVGCW